MASYRVTFFTYRIKLLWRLVASVSYNVPLLTADDSAMIIWICHSASHHRSPRRQTSVMGNTKSQFDSIATFIVSTIRFGHYIIRLRPRQNVYSNSTRYSQAVTHPSTECFIFSLNNRSFRQASPRVGKELTKELRRVDDESLSLLARLSFMTISLLDCSSFFFVLLFSSFFDSCDRQLVNCT